VIDLSYIDKRLPTVNIFYLAPGVAPKHYIRRSWSHPRRSYPILPYPIPLSLSFSTHASVRVNQKENIISGTRGEEKLFFKNPISQTPSKLLASE